LARGHTLNREFQSVHLQLVTNSIRFYQVKLNKIGIAAQSKLNPLIMFTKAYREEKNNSSDAFESSANLLRYRGESASNSVTDLSMFPPAIVKQRRMVLIATMEYDIEDWAIKVKIGGLGVMAQLMGKNRTFAPLLFQDMKLTDS
jgi:alpha-1,3-glucan synthase